MNAKIYLSLCCIEETHCSITLGQRDGQRIFKQMNPPQKKAGVAIFISSTQGSGTPTEDEAERLQL